MDRSVSGAQPGSPAERERLARIMDEQANDAEGTARLCRRIGTTEIAATHDRDATDLRAIAALLRGETRHDAAQEERWALDAQRLDWLERVREPLAPFLDRGFPVWRVADYEQDVTLRGAIDRARKELSGQPSLPSLDPEITEFDAEAFRLWLHNVPDATNEAAAQWLRDRLSSGNSSSGGSLTGKDA